MAAARGARADRRMATSREGSGQERWARRAAAPRAPPRVARAAPTVACTPRFTAGAWQAAPAVRVAVGGGAARAAWIGAVPARPRSGPGGTTVASVVVGSAGGGGATCVVDVDGTGLVVDVLVVVGGTVVVVVDVLVVVVDVLVVVVVVGGGGLRQREGLTCDIGRRSRHRDRRRPDDVPPGRRHDHDLVAAGSVPRERVAPVGRGHRHRRRSPGPEHRVAGRIPQLDGRARRDRGGDAPRRGGHRAADRERLRGEPRLVDRNAREHGEAEAQRGDRHRRAEPAGRTAGVGPVAGECRGRRVPRGHVGERWRARARRWPRRVRGSS